MDHTRSTVDEDEVRQALESFVARAGNGDVEVEFNSGTATLRGTVESPNARLAYRDLVLAHDGVERVVNELAVSAAGVAGRAPR